MISTNYVYLLSEIDIHESGNAFEQSELKIKANLLKDPMNLETTCATLFERLHDLYDIDLFIFRSESSRTILDLRYVLKSTFEPDFRNSIVDSIPTFHAKVGIPPTIGIDEKFDVNWEYNSYQN